MTSRSETSWNSPTLNKGFYMTLDFDEGNMTVSHVDRTVDPYLAGVVKDGIIIYTGLHSTLAGARNTCIEKSGILP